MNSKLPLASVPILIAQDFQAIEAQYKERIELYLNNRIYSRTLIAGNVGKEFEMNIGKTVNIGIRGTGTIVGKAAPGIIKHIPGLAIEIGAGVLVGGVAFTLEGVVAAVLVGVVAGAVIFARKRSKNRIRAKAKVYQSFFPTEKSIINLFSQLMTLSVTEELNAIKSRPAEVGGTLSYLKKTLQGAWRVVYGTKAVVKEDEVQQLVKILSKAEMQKIWKIFKIFARQPEKYAEFANSDKAKAMLALFEESCDLGDAQDNKKVINDWKVNVFWLNIFACYLQEKGEKIVESVISALSAKFSAAAALQALSSLKENHVLQEQMEILQGQFNVLQTGLEKALQANDSVSSVAWGSQDSLISQNSATESTLGVRNPFVPLLFRQSVLAHAQSTAAEDLQFAVRHL